MKKLKILRHILKITGMWGLIQGFVMFLLAAAVAILMLEPTITSYGDALWMLFTSFTTIGYGDFVPTNLISRGITVVVSLYGILLVAFIPAVIISYFTQVIKDTAQDTTLEYLDKLENLPNLSHDELVALSKQIKKRRKNITKKD